MLCTGRRCLSTPLQTVRAVTGKSHGSRGTYSMRARIPGQLSSETHSAATGSVGCGHPLSHSNQPPPSTGRAQGPVALAHHTGTIIFVPAYSSSGGVILPGKYLIVKQNQ